MWSVWSNMATYSLLYIIGDGLVEMHWMVVCTIQGFSHK